ncbi:MAG: DUF2924 domain-containing protein [Sphingomicrobium sp.]
MEDLARQISALEKLRKAELRERWTKVTARRAPSVSAPLLRLAIAWELQARMYGGLSRQTQQRLEQVARGKTRTRTSEPGMRLVRAWNGRTHIVTVGEDGVIRWNDREWRSLSEVARAITGTRWSGPAFFGLKQKRVA